MENIAAVWERYATTKDKKLRDILIVEYAPLVKYLAGRIGVHIGHKVEYDDLISYGIFGLIDAIDKFDLSKGVKFETYASLRIRGSIIDSIRKMDWVPRDLRQKNKQLETVYVELEIILEREPTEKEIAEKLNISIEETRDLMKKAAVVNLVSLDDYLEQNHEDTFFSTADDPESNYQKTEVRDILVNAIDKLSEKEKKVVSLYYFEDLTLKEISKIMGVTESRISQIHSKAVTKLRTKLGKYKSVMDF
ncbi:MAG: FliA/WhiG family RNA polymerase sigma factor [Defluviitaleaceae bacterium]|nr:FliA/WhiG family RNA polymerase sigma factor [Defluviitaleaceae bacterium]